MIETSHKQNFNEHMDLPTQLKFPAAQGRPPQHNAPSARPEAWAEPILTIQNHKWKVAAIVLQNIILSQFLQASPLRYFLDHSTTPCSCNPHTSYTRSQPAPTKWEPGWKGSKKCICIPEVSFSYKVCWKCESCRTARFVSGTHIHTQSLNLSSPPAL